MLRNYKMYEFTGSYNTKDHIRDNFGETTGNMEVVKQSFNLKVVSSSQQLAEAYVQSLYDKEWNTDFNYLILQIEQAPHCIFVQSY